jgi:2-keto-4-pentenoate hydratase/2-oxohepta-3-ene-1,7-dioic acid hydratase in catechol pathway
MAKKTAVATTKLETQTMKLARFIGRDNQPKYGIIENESINITDDEWHKTGVIVPLSEIKLVAPVSPPNVIAIGMNYSDHAKELGTPPPPYPVLFLKPTTSVTGPNTDILLPKTNPDNVDYEAELAIVIKKTAKNVTEQNAHEYILGYTCGNDVSARDAQMKDVASQWAHGKSFDTFCPLGPWIETDVDTSNLTIQSRLNNKIMQSSTTGMMIFNPSVLVSYLSHCMTLLPGTVILSGTPFGCGFARKPPVFMRPGDIIEIEISGIGILSNTVRAEPA